MTFELTITEIELLPRAGIGVITGTIVQGFVHLGDQLILRHPQKDYVFRVDGIVLSSKNAFFSISVVLKNEVFTYAKIGDTLESI